MFSSRLLTDLGWSNHFLGQLTEEELETTFPARLTEVHRDRASALTQDGPRDLNLPGGQSTGDLAVGDWCLFDAETGRILRVLDRKSRLARRAAGEVAREQLIAANVDTAFLTTSCNADFNEARIERYLALIHTGGIEPVILITKSDMTDDPQSFLDRVRSIAPKTVALAVDARDPASASQLSPWTSLGQTVCFLGSSGVGKSTLAVSLTGLNLATGAIREDDAKGRHTTTNRALFRIPDGGWLIDTPGMRELRLSDVSEGIEITFADLADLERQCRFSDCKHEAEPGCAIRAAIGQGTLDPARLVRWQKLRREDQFNSASVAELRSNARRFGKMTRNAGKHKRGWDTD